MSFFTKLKRLLFSRKSRFFYFNKLGLNNSMSDERYLKKLYFYTLNKELNLDDPKSFNEKLQWLKLNDRNPNYTRMVDKYEAKNYVSSKIGEEYIVPTLGIYDSFEEIDFDALPEQFVLKCTHDSGGLVICRDKNQFDKKAAKRKIKKSLKRDFFYCAREWPYKNVQKRILAEQYMSDKADSDVKGLTDYKFYCFGGNPKFLYISEGLENHDIARISFVNLDWTFAPYERSDYAPFDTLPEKPTKFDEMLDIAKKLSEGIPFLRVDLYQINDRVYFSELTFSPCAGFMPFKNEEHDLELGSLINLPKR